VGTEDGEEEASERAGWGEELVGVGERLGWGEELVGVGELPVERADIRSSDEGTTVTASALNTPLAGGGLGDGAGSGGGVSRRAARSGSGSGSTAGGGRGVTRGGGARGGGAAVWGAELGLWKGDAYGRGLLFKEGEI